VGGNAPINIQAVAAAQTVKAYVKQVPDELSLAVSIRMTSAGLFHKRASFCQSTFNVCKQLYFLIVFG
jgi:hypothetical protein